MLSLEDDTQSKQTEQQSQQEDESKLKKKKNKWEMIFLTRDKVELF